MPDQREIENEDISLYAVGAMLIAGWRKVFGWALVGGVVAGIAVAGRPAKYVATASFIAQGSDPTRQGLAAFAGQFGVSIPGGQGGLTPDFFGKLIRSPVVFRTIASDTLVVEERGRVRIAFTDLFGAKGDTPQARIEDAMRILSDVVTVSVAKTTGVVELQASTEMPSVSLAVARAVIDGVNAFLMNSRQSQGAAERKFVEARLSIAGAELRAAEDKIETFVQANREYAQSATLMLQHGRLSRDLTLKQTVYTSLTQSLEEARLREVRDTPVITMLESPSVPALPLPRGRVKFALIGVLLGAFFGAMLAVVTGMAARRVSTQDPDAAELFAVLRALRDRVFARAPWLERLLRTVLSVPSSADP